MMLLSAASFAVPPVPNEHDRVLLPNKGNITELLFDQIASGFVCTWECGSSMIANFDLEVSRSCWECMLNARIGQLPWKYTSDMLQFKLGTGYTKGWCGTRGTFHPTEGVDISQHPSGWKPDPANAGKYIGCETTTDFPGIGATSYNSHAYVFSELSKIPKLQNDGTVWRGNELGFIISNQNFWHNVIPNTIGLGATASQHKVIRPILDRLVGTCDSTCQSGLYDSAVAAQAGHKLSIQTDIIKWVHIELFKKIFGAAETIPYDVDRFVSLQGKTVTYSTLAQLLSDSLTKSLCGSTIDALDEMFQAYKPLVQKHFGTELAAKDAECLPTNSCVDLATSNLMDLLLFAGGLSVPGGISTGLWVLHADSSAYGDMFPQGYKLSSDDTKGLLFYYEALRFFAPVVGFPWWTTPPAVATDDTKGQFSEGSKRKVLNLAMAQKDPNAWGADSHKFRVRTLQEYKDKFVGFANQAVDSTVANGAMNRACPAIDLAMQMGKAWFSAHDQDGWCTQDTPTYKEATPFVDAFTLFKGKKPGASCTPQVNPWSDSECCSGSCSWVRSSWWRGSWKCSSS